MAYATTSSRQLGLWASDRNSTSYRITRSGKSRISVTKLPHPRQQRRQGDRRPQQRIRHRLLRRNSQFADRQPRPRGKGTSGPRIRFPGQVRCLPQLSQLAQGPETPRHRAAGITGNLAKRDPARRRRRPRHTGDKDREDEVQRREAAMDSAEVDSPSADPTDGEVDNLRRPAAT